MTVCTPDLSIQGFAAVSRGNAFKDPIGVIGAPCQEVDLLRMHSQRAGFDQLLQRADRASGHLRFTSQA